MPYNEGTNKQGQPTKGTHAGFCERRVRRRGRLYRGTWKPNNERGRKMTNTEKLFRDSIIKAYVSVMGAEKWDNLTNAEKDMVLHIMVRDMAKANGIR